MKITRRLLAMFTAVLLCIGLCACDDEEEKTKPLKIKEVSLEMPVYWEEEGSETGCLKYFAEKNTKGLSEYKSATLDIEFVVDSDPDYDVSFEGLYADNENMISGLETRYNGANVLDHEIFESENGVKGILYSFSLNIEVGMFSEEAAKGFCFCFASEADRRWYYITMIIAKTADEYEYENDYMKMIGSIKYTGAQ